MSSLGVPGAKAVVDELFGDIPVLRDAKGDLTVVMPLTNFHPAIKPYQMEVLVTMMVDKIPWAGVDAVVGIADRSSGPLTHAVAQRKNLPYSLTNWYPEGSIGDIEVEKSGGFTGGEGVVFLNGLSKGMKVVVIDDVLRTGKTVANLVRAVRSGGVEVVAIATATDFESLGGRKMLMTKFPKTPVVSVCTVDTSGKKTKIAKYPEFGKSKPSPVPTFATIKEIKALPLSVIKEKFNRILDAFVGVPIYYAKNSSYPYCNFTLTDFKPLLEPQLVEDMADCMVYLGNFEEADILVSEADRGGGPLILAVAARTGLPYTLAGWQSSGADIGADSAAQVGYSGSGRIYLNGVPKGAKCAIVDDMLSSGGTAEALFNTVEAAGGVVVEAHFASEKVNTGGRVRLAKKWPTLKMYSLCYFLAKGDKTIAKPPTPTGNSTPIQKHPNPILALAAEHSNSIIALGIFVAALTSFVIKTK